MYNHVLDINIDVYIYDIIYIYMYTFIDLHGLHLHLRTAPAPSVGAPSFARQIGSSRSLGDFGEIPSDHFT